MEPTEDNDERLQSAALQTASSILLLRQSAERELIHARDALEAKT